jgi:hypothetical protein
VKDRSDDLSTADLAGQSAGSGGATVADERGQTGEESLSERRADADRVDDGSLGDRAGLTDDRRGGAEATFGERPGLADDAGYADPADRDSAGYADPADRDSAAYGDSPDPDRGGYADSVPGDRPGFAGDASAARGVPGDRDEFAGADRDPAARGESGDRAWLSDDAPGDRGAAGVGAGSPRGPAAGTAAAGTSGGHEAGPLLPPEQSEGFRARWTDVQTGFVDAPRRAVEQADGLVAELMQHLAKTFADERGQLESQWDRGDDVPTDDLRTAFQRYRSFFERLLST